ncbi:MAG: peptide MFS transporter [Proteobacteria bacterium]|nr:peptide MFS transporter [Pseudomonadota bacterium]
MLGKQTKSFPSTFWVANTMEIFERLSWYGWFTVMALYVTAPPETGGLGFTTETRGMLMGVVPFFLYLMPVLTGALADRYGYKKMLIIAYLVMIVAYYLLGQFTSLPTFFMAFMFVAVGAAIFKPVVVGTIARVTDETNSAIGFGIFYMMVNVGGFLGPVVAGVVRGWSWDYVFIACSFWAFINLLIVLVFYKEPTTEASSGKARNLKKVLDDAVEVLGNLRFFIAVFVILIALMLANLDMRWFSWTACGVFVPVWLLANFAYDAVLPKDSGKPETPKRNPLAKRMFCSNWRFALFLLIMSGFWTAFNQIFITMPEYIRDFSETKPLISTFQSVFDNEDADPDGVVKKIATISDLERKSIADSIQKMVEADTQGKLDDKTLNEGTRALLASKVRLPPARIKALVVEGKGDVLVITGKVIDEGRQFNPEFIVNINAGAIVLFQVLVSFFMGRFHRFTTMIAGMCVAGVGIGLSAFAGAHGMLGAGGSIWLVALGLLTFSFGEMMASPTSQEYVGRIAPRTKVALYMGYYFVAVALGNLFGGILSGQMYGKLARDMERPDLMWMGFGALMFITAFIFLLYNRFALPKGEVEELAEG